MGSFVIDFIPKNIRAPSQKDIFEIWMPDSFKLIDGQYVIRLNTSFDHYKAESVVADGLGNNVFRFVIGRIAVWANSRRQRYL